MAQRTLSRTLVPVLTALVLAGAAEAQTGSRLGTSRSFWSQAAPAAAVKQAATKRAEPPASDDQDEGMGSTASILISSYDAEAKAGRLLSVTEDGESNELMSRPGEAVQQVHEVHADGLPLALVIWRSMRGEPALHAEVWTNDGFPQLVSGGVDRIRWRDARVQVQQKKGQWVIKVARSLDGENTVAPLLRKREIYKMTARGLKLLGQKREKISTPEQALNWVADQGRLGRFDDLKPTLLKLQKAGGVNFQRATLQLTRLRGTPATRHQARMLLDMLAARSKNGGVVTAAADRILEMSWEDSAKYAISQEASQTETD